MKKRKKLRKNLNRKKERKNLKKQRKRRKLFEWRKYPKKERKQERNMSSIKVKKGRKFFLSDGNEIIKYK